jgi:hypothetical protein
MDITKTVEPRSDQLNFDDVATHDLTITIVEVKGGPPDQPVHLHNAEFPGRPYKPGKSMRRVLIAAWGTEASAYVGRKITLYGDPTIRFCGWYPYQRALTHHRTADRRPHHHAWQEGAVHRSAAYRIR